MTMNCPDRPTHTGQANTVPNPWTEHEPPVRYINGRVRTTAIVLCGEIFWLLLIGVVHSSGTPTREFLAALAALVLLIALRCAISFVLVLTPDHVTSRTLTRTRQWRYIELRSAQALARPARKPSRKVILLTPRVGRPCKFTTPGDEPESPSAFDPAVAEINARIFLALMDEPTALS
jgi:hypothetical protein